MPITVPPAPTFEIQHIREQAAAVIAAAVNPTPVKIHKEWKLRVDLGQIVSMLYVDNTTNIHAWMVGSANAVPETNAQGDTPWVGSKICDYQIKIDLWGFFDSKLKDPVSGLSGESIAEAEALWIADVFRANRNHMGFDVKPAELRRVLPMSIDNLDTHSFSEGVDVWVAQCSLPVVIRR